MDINKRYKHGELGSGDVKAKPGKLEINPDMKIKQGDLSTASDKPGKKDKVDPSIFKMASQKDYQQVIYMSDNFIAKEDNLNYRKKKDTNILNSIMKNINDGTPTPDDYRKLKAIIPQAVKEFELKNGDVGFSLNRNAIKKWKSKGKDS